MGGGAGKGMVGMSGILKGGRFGKGKPGIFGKGKFGSGDWNGSWEKGKSNENSWDDSEFLISDSWSSTTFKFWIFVSVGPDLGEIKGRA